MRKRRILKETKAKQTSPIPGLARFMKNQKYGYAARELFVQFMARIAKRNANSHVGHV